MLSKRKNNFNNLSEEYLKDKSEVTFYNLPKKVEFCKTCTISNQKLLYTIAKSSAVQNMGGIIVLEMNQNDYSMSEIASIVESNNAKILSSYITSTPDSTKMELTIKVNISELDAIISDLKRFEYQVMAFYHDGGSKDDMMERYESLMRYLNP